MPISRILSAGLRGIDAYPIDVEVDIRFGLPSWTTVGLPEGAVKESRDRVIAAIKNSGYSFEKQKITINLSPADIKKQGTAFDLPIALGLMASSKLLDHHTFAKQIFIGELCLDGRIKPVPGVLPIALLAKQKGWNRLVLPTANASEASVVTGLKISPVNSLQEVVRGLTGESPFRVFEPSSVVKTKNRLPKKDFCDVKGQYQARRAIEIAVAGRHNLLLIGPPGSGKTMLAERIPTILPPMTLEESLETTKIYSVVGKIDPQNPLIYERPFRAPHHSISTAGLIGGGSYPRPGEVSFAHHGVLFLDELPEFPRSIIELLRQPLEGRTVTIARASSTLTFPASFILAAACNPCPCGYFGSQLRPCRCTTYRRLLYRTKLSGPLLDRIDLHVDVPALDYPALAQKKPGESSAKMRQRIMEAQQRQRERFAKEHNPYNAQMSHRDLKRYCHLDPKGQLLIKQAVEKLGLSARAYDRILKVARTIADLDKKTDVTATHIAEAISYRSLDREDLV